MFEYQLFCEISSFLYSTGTLPITPIPLAPYSRLITTNDAQSFPLSFLTPPTVQQRPLGTFTGDQLLWYELQLAHPLSLLGLFTGRNHRISAPPSLDHLDPLFFLDCSLLTPMISINNNSIPFRGQSSSMSTQLVLRVFLSAAIRSQLHRNPNPDRTLSSLNGAERRWNGANSNNERRMKRLRLSLSVGSIQTR
jgi:hypothetical protein